MDGYVTDFSNSKSQTKKELLSVNESKSNHISFKVYFYNHVHLHVFFTMQTNKLIILVNFEKLAFEAKM